MLWPQSLGALVRGLLPPPPSGRRSKACLPHGQHARGRQREGLGSKGPSMTTRPCPVKLLPLPVDALSHGPGNIPDPNCIIRLNALDQVIGRGERVTCADGPRGSRSKGSLLTSAYPTEPALPITDPPLPESTLP